MSDNRASYPLRLEPELKEKIERLAKANYLSFNAMVCQMLAWAITELGERRALMIRVEAGEEKGS